MEITPGLRITVRDAVGAEHEMEALSGIEVEGHDLPIVWVKRPLRDGTWDRMPWPLSDVLRATDAVGA